MSETETDILLLERPSDHVALLRLNRPDVLNALNLPLRLALAEQLSSLDDDPNVRAIVITGSEQALAAGADLLDLQKRGVLNASTKDSRAAWSALEACSKPIIAAVNGFALGGGCELALHCDIIIAGEGAKFGLPEVKVGIMPGAGGTQRLLRAVGKYKASRYLLTGDFISAAEAYDMDLVSEVVPDADVLEHALKIASKIAERPPLSVSAIKEMIALGPEASLPAALMLERKAFQVLFAADDRDEGISAFLEKRKPDFQGK